MSQYSCSPLSESSIFGDSQFKILNSLAIVVLMLAIASGSAYGSSAPRAGVTPSADCHVVEPDGDSSVDVHALDDYGTFIRHLLVQGRYGDLDCIADSARANKTKFRGGFWKLHTIYMGLSKPVDDDAHATEADWNDHIDRLKRWMSAKPDSVTARIALAQVYIDFAWAARGEGSAGTVTDNGWRLIAERTNQAQEILAETYKLPTKCPEWYLTAQELAQLQGTDKQKLNRILDQAISFEPSYQYFYRIHASLLAAKWYGDDGDEENFAEQAADRIGGTEGDILYFQITSHVICPCNDDVDLKLLSWPRMQKGFKALTEKSGSSLITMNLLAYMAIKEADPTVAEQTFTTIGEGWDSSLWHTKSFFDRNKEWASGAASTVAWERSLQEKADADMSTPEGMAIKKSFDEKFAVKIQKCATSFSGNELQPFTFFVRVGEKGVIRQLIALPSTKVSDCIVKQGPELLLSPTHAPISLKIEIDPTKLMTASVQ